MRRCYAHFLVALNRSPSDAEFESLNGPPLAEVVRRLKRAHGLEAAEDELLARYEDLLDRLYRDVEPNEGAAALLRRAHEGGYLTAVVTSNSRPRVLRWLEITGLAPHVDTMITSEDVRIGKPDPEPYLVALARTRTAASEAAAVEDSRQGAQAALAAGIRTFLLRPAGLGGAAPDGVISIGSLGEIATHLWP